MSTKRKIGVIGAAGFIGSRVRKLLENSNNIEVCCLDINGLDAGSISFGDVEDIGSLSVLNGCEVVINLAAEHKDNVKPTSRYHDVNVQGAINICRIAEQFDIRHIIFTSSVAVYGFALPNTGEDGAINYFNEYGKTKYEAEGIYRAWQAKASDIRTLTVVRPTVVFGEGNRGNVYNLINQIMTRRFIMIGNGLNVKSMAYVENVASFLVFCIDQKSKYELFNYVDKPDMSMKALIELVRSKTFNKKGMGLSLPIGMASLAGKLMDFASRLVGRELPISSIRVKKFLATTQFSSRVLQSGFSPRYGLSEALERTIKHEFLERG